MCWVDGAMMGKLTVVPPLGPRISMRISFAQDFAPLEAALSRQKREGVFVVTPEQLIVELCLRPKSVKQIERRFGVELGWFSSTYAALRRQRLLPNRPVLWETWLRQYLRAKISRE